MFVKSIAAAGLALGLVSAANALTVVNLDGRVNASTNGTNAVTINLAPGRYQVTFTEGLFTAHNRFRGAAQGCDREGMNCTRGWETNASFYLGANDFVSNNDFDVGNFTYYSTRALAFGASSAFQTPFTVPSGGSTVSFYIFDPLITDNIEGVSLLVSVVPEASAWAMLIAGFGLVGLVARRRRAGVAAS